MGALITIVNFSNDETQTAKSDSSGQYRLANLAPGSYEISATKRGFNRASVRSAVDVRRQLQANLTLEMNTDVTENPVAALSLSRELEAMKERIGQLESELKKQSPKTEVLLASTGNDASQFPRLGTLTNRADDSGRLMASTSPLSLPEPFPARSAAPAATVPQAPAVPTPAAPEPSAVDTTTPFADHDWTWMNGNSRQHDSPLDSKYFSGEFRADTFYGIDTNQPRDHSMGGSSEVFRNGEIQLEDLSIGGDFHAGNVRGRVLALFGLFAATTVRNDASPSVGQWDVRAAYKYVSEAYGGYHFNVNRGLNVDAGIFVSYVGLFSYHNFDNWAYQPSYVSSNTPWFFNGVRVQWFPTNHLKIEPWIINGWQSYNKFNGHPGVGGQVKWTPNGWLTIIGNQYAVGNDNVGLPKRARYHTDNSVEVKYYDNPNAGNGINRMAFTFTGDLGCETGMGVTCHGGKGPYNPVTGNGGPKQSFIGYMAYNRWWWNKDKYAFTLGGGQINNPGRYLTLVLPVNGADAISGTPYFPASPGSSFKAWDGTATLDWMPSQFFTFRTEVGYRHSNVPYWSGRGGVTPPNGNNSAPGQYACNDGAPSGAVDVAAARIACGQTGVWFPDLRKGQGLVSFSLLVKF